MSGKRILDAAAIYKASRGVAIKHIALRQRQLDHYSKTSSLAKAVKSQTDRVTLTVQAAASLAQRFNESGPEDVRTQGTRRPERGQEQKDAPANADGNYMNDKASGREYESQRHSEGRSSSQTAGPIPSAASVQRDQGAAGQQQDIFSERLVTNNDDSSLSSDSLQNESATSQANDRHVQDLYVHQDASNSTKSEWTATHQQRILPEYQAIPEQEELPEEAYAGIFQSRRVSNMLRRDSTLSSASESLDLPGSGDAPRQEWKNACETDQVSSSDRLPISKSVGEASEAVEERTSERGNEANQIYSPNAEMTGIQDITSMKDSNVRRQYKS